VGLACFLRSYVDPDRAMELDALRTSHAIATDVEDPSEISQLFDSISYSKGASIIRMLEAYLDTFSAQGKLPLTDVILGLRLKSAIYIYIYIQPRKPPTCFRMASMIIWYSLHIYPIQPPIDTLLIIDIIHPHI